VTCREGNSPAAEGCQEPVETDAVPLHQGREAVKRESAPVTAQQALETLASQAQPSRGGNAVPAILPIDQCLDPR
jgi:hypothetical protein